MPRAEFLNRRSFLMGAAGGFAAARVIGDGVFGNREQQVAARNALTVAATANNASPLAPRLTHIPAKAKQLLIVVLAGGISHIDAFDPKPKLRKDDGKLVPNGFNNSLPLMSSPFSFKQYGESGMWISELLPHFSTVVDDLAVIRSMHTDHNNHIEASLALHTGSASVPLPSIGAWLSYGLGTFNRNLPSYMVLASEPNFAGSLVIDNNFLPPIHQGVRITPGPDPIPNLKSPVADVSLRQLEQQMLRDANDIYGAERPGDLTLNAATHNFEMAERMTDVAAEVLDVSQETKSTLESYGVSEKGSIGLSCLMARRLIERGVRVVELIDSGTLRNWDSHVSMLDHRRQAKLTDKPLAALINDMKQRGLLDDTLVAICTEFGRTPWKDPPNSTGRNHLATAFTCMFAGAGIKSGTICGATDEYGATVVADPCHIHDYHATILHLMGIDHTRLTYRYAGRDFRLTDVHGNVMQQVLT